MLSEASYHNMTVGRIPSVEGGIQPTLLTTKGDIIVATGNATLVRQGVGANGTVLTANSAQADGVEWVAPSAPANFSLISSASLSGSTTTISGISGMNQLYVLINGCSTTGGGNQIRLRMNTDTGANYDEFRNEIYGNSSWAATNIAGHCNLANTNILLTITSNFAASAYFGGAMISGCNTAGNKMVQFAGGSTAGGGSGQTSLSGLGRYFGTSAISSISINSDGTFDAGTVFVYGSA